MPSPTRVLTPQSARDLIRERSFTKRTGNSVGVELEWFTTPSSDPPGVPTLERLLHPLAPLPCGSRITFEPGGQVELSTPPLGSIDEACHAAQSDSAAVRLVLKGAGFGTFAAGFDPQRTHRLLTDVPRYVAMRRYFDAYGPAGGRMMCASGSIHVNLDAGDDEVGRRRWRLAHAVGPMLVAAFANSPFDERGVSGHKSSRMAAWLELDPTRTGPVTAIAHDPLSAWADYALSANVMFIRSDSTYVPLDDALTLGAWIAHGHPLGFPTEDDVLYHLTTLFPPVRPHGHLELRMIDMLPPPWWRAAVAIVTALLCDARASAIAEATCSLEPDLWGLAARCGLEDPTLRTWAAACFPEALRALDRMGCDGVTRRAAHGFVERFTEQGLTPADELLAELGGSEDALSRASTTWRAT